MRNIFLFSRLKINFDLCCWNCIIITRILFFSPVNADLNFSWNYYKFIVIIWTVLFCILIFSYFCIFPYTHANSVTCLCPVKYARK